MKFGLNKMSLSIEIGHQFIFSCVIGHTWTIHNLKTAFLKAQKVICEIPPNTNWFQIDQSASD